VDALQTIGLLQLNKLSTFPICSFDKEKFVQHVSGTVQTAKDQRLPVVHWTKGLNLMPM